MATCLLPLQLPNRLNGHGSWSVVCGCYESCNWKGPPLHCCGLLSRSLLRGWRIPGYKPDSAVWGPLRAKSYVVVKRHPVGVRKGAFRENCKLRCCLRHLTVV
ncbi:hypothetical protein AVEN_251677-1 [Araneus ventricosus]|uniref:Uncharacterized protein n=1 Tax=Araneus ventricosus TaxID=182803 RepID=A0A4Y2HFK5_ARAVE|nr:hypothetical protein AVEN_251677-1 [Araneus ventricosus]